MIFSPDETILVGADYSGAITLWNVKTGKVLQTLGQRKKDVVTLAFSPDNRTLAVALADKTVYLQRVK